MSSWVNIASAAIDVDSPITTTLLTNLRDNGAYNNERALRAGTHATGVRLAFARGKEAISDTSDGGGLANMTATVTFSSGSTDGNPNFTSAPTVYVILEEDTAGASWLMASQTWTVFLDDIPTTSGFTAQVRGSGVTNTTVYNGFVNWIAVGPVTSGE